MGEGEVTFFFFKPNCSWTHSTFTLIRLIFDIIAVGWTLRRFAKFQTDLVVFKELQKKSRNRGSDAYKEVDDDEEDIGCTGNLKPEGCRVHDRSDGPPGKESNI